MSVIKELKTFMLRGNVVDMAVGVVIGGAFGKIVSSLVSDVIMPPLGLLVGDVDFTNLKVILKAATEELPAVTINYGNFIQTVFDFIIIGVSIFFAIKGINVLSSKLEKEKEPEKKEETPVIPAPSKEELLLTEIRDLLKARENK